MLLLIRMLAFVCSMPWRRKGKPWTQCHLVPRTLNSTSPLFFHLDKQSTAMRIHWSDHVDMHTCTYIWLSFRYPLFLFCTSFGAYIWTVSIQKGVFFLLFFSFLVCYSMFCLLKRRAFGLDVHLHSILYRQIYIDRLFHVKIQSNSTVHGNHARMK